MRRTAGLAILLATMAGCGATPGERVYVSNERSGDITVIDPKTDTVVRRIVVGSRPRGIQYRNGKLYAALTNLGTRRPDARAAIAEIDVLHGDRIRWLPSGPDPEQLAVSRDARRIYVSNEDAGAASIIDVPAARILQTLVVGLEPEGVALSPDGRWCFVTGESSNSVAVLDTASGEVAANVMVEGRPRGAAFSPDGTRAYVSCELGGSLCVLDVAARKVRACSPLGPGERPVGIAVSGDGREVFAATGRGNTVAIFDADGKLVGRIPVGQRPWGIGLAAGGTKLYAGNGLSNDISVIDVATRRPLRTIRGGDGPWGIAVGN